MNCPRCGRPIDEHDAGRETDYCVAEVVMGYRHLPTGTEIRLPTVGTVIVTERTSEHSGKILTPLWTDGKGNYRREEYYGMFGFPPHYTTDISAAWDMEHKIANSNSRVRADYITALCKYVDATDYSANYQEMLDISQAKPLFKCRAALKACAK